MTTESRQAKTHAGNKDAAPATNEPIIISMGKKTRKQVRKLTKGKPGRLMERVEEAIEHLREEGAMAPDAQPIVIVIRQRPKRNNRRMAKASKVFGLG